MTAAQIAEILDARHTGNGKWQARCPAHQDRSPSLSIGVGRDGRALVHCFAGCPLDSILRALGLTRRDLFAGPPPSPERARQMAQEREGREVEARKRRAAHGAACDRVLGLQRVSDALFAKSARLSGPSGDAVAALGHEVLRHMRNAEAELDTLR
jgi:hypothetical protein